MLSWPRKTLVDVRTGTIYERVVGQLEDVLIFMHEKAYTTTMWPLKISLFDGSSILVVHPIRRGVGFVGTLLYAHKYIVDRPSKVSVGA